MSTTASPSDPNHSIQPVITACCSASVSGMPPPWYVRRYFAMVVAFLGCVDSWGGSAVDGLRSGRHESGGSAGVGDQPIERRSGFGDRHLWPESFADACAGGGQLPELAEDV